MTGARTRTITRLVVAVVFALPVVLSALSLSSLAAPSAEEVQAANEKLARLEHDFEALAEQYIAEKYRL
jgi:outer membrane murein-binding lipoprotein Lpp